MPSGCAPSLPNYELTAKIAEGPSSTVYRAHHKRHPERRLALKLLRVPPHAGRLAQFRQRIEHLRVLACPLVITPLEVVAHEGGCFVTQDYFEGVPLDELARSRLPLPLATFFTIASTLAQALQEVHEAGIIHGGIKPHNVLVAPDTLEVRLIDFIGVLDVRDISHFVFEPVFVRTTLPYTSPEQTGRISHRVTFASDLYSLGIVCYELLTGQLPFLSEDPLELIHSHLAEEAPRPSELDPAIPRALSNIVARLLVKEPEKRYQSAGALLSDLERCRSEYGATGTVQDFPLEGSVNPNRVTFISKMVGRDAEARTILDRYEQAARGSFRAVLISGLSGIGKTRLIQELQQPIVRHRGYFTSGKFDVYQKNIPYSSLIQALRHLVRTFLTESDGRVAEWKARIQTAVGDRGKVLTDVIPELEVLIGAQPEPKPLPPVESLNRFHDVFDRFLGCLASREHPLTIFIDDLQWCDVASFDFLANLFANHASHPFLFFLGAYRHNEVDSTHPLVKLLRDAAASAQPLEEIRLAPLEPAHCHAMVSYILDAPLEQTEAISAFISALSEGNPLFVSESLSYLHTEQLLYLDADRQWRWNLERIRRSRMPTTVVALFSAKIRRLPPPLVELLECCACMGNTFSPSHLSAVKELSLQRTFELLKPALGAGLLMENKNDLQFIHDKVQEATLQAIPEQRRRLIHWQIGMHLLTARADDGTPTEHRDDLFTIASHLELGRPSELDAKTAYFLSDIDFFAGNKALDSLAMESANELFRLSRELLPADCWERDHYERTFRIYQRAAKSELMCGHYEASEALLGTLLDHAETDLDKAECLAEQTTSLSSIGNFIKAIETANRGLAYFDKAMPASRDEADARREALAARIAGRSADVWKTILEMPFTTDRRSKIELVFYSELIPDLYMSGLVPQLYLSAAQSTDHCLAGGMDESVIYALSIMGLQLGEQGRFEDAFRYEDLARDLSARHPNTFGATRGMNGIVWCNMHSRSTPRQIVEYARKSIQCGKNCGDLYNAGLSFGPLMWNLQVQGADLAAIEEAARECLAFSNRYHLSFSVGLAEAVLAGWVEPMKRGYVPAPMADKLAKWEQDNHIASAGSYCVHMALSHYYLGEHEEAHEQLRRVRKYLSGLTDNVLKRQWTVFDVLSDLKRHELGLDPRSLGALVADVAPALAKIEAWAALGPLLRPYLAFLRAELARVSGELGRARGLYLDAIDLAHAQEYTLLEGHLNECLGDLLVQAGQHRAGLYFGEAARLYRRCHATRKAMILAERRGEYLDDEKPLAAAAEGGPAPAHILPDLDTDYLMKSSLAISAEIEPEALLKKIMNVVIESSAAQHGYLLIEEGGVLVIRAESHTGDKHVARTVHRRLDDAEDVCKAIVRYVYRTRERVMLADAGRDGPFCESAEVQSLHLRSVLCLPLIKQTNLIGVLYLENRLASGVFTSTKAQMTELLTSPAAISLENSRLVEEMRKAEEAITRSLREKEVLLREIHHRVKNNLQIIQSMLNLQVASISDAHAIELHKESQNRVHSMALIHEKLYQSESLSRIDFAEYVDGLLANLFQSYGVSERSVRPRVTVGGVALDVDTVIPCALIINELVSNSLKHAFPAAWRRANQPGEIRIDLHPGSDGGLVLSVADNGVGLPEGFEPDRCVSLGLQLVSVLSRQLRGTLEVCGRGGAAFTISFVPVSRKVG